MIILIHGAAAQKKEFINSADKMLSSQYNLITSFYQLCERDKYKIPPTEVKVFEEFLGSTTNSRRSISNYKIF